MLHEGTVRASRSLREDLAKTLRQAGFKRSSRLLREGFVEPPRCLSGESPSRRHRDVFAVPSRRHHYGGFMNPSFEAFVDPPDGFHEKPGTRSNREGQFSPPEARMVVEPRMQLLGLCSFDARRKKKAAEKYFLGVEKVIWPPNTITRRCRKKKKKPGFFRLGAEKYCSVGARRKSRFLVLGAEKTKKQPKKQKWGPKKNCGGRIYFGGGRKSYLAAKHHNETAPKKKKKKFFSAWAPKNTTLGRLGSKGLATFFRGLREPFR